jgi:hypothetical protein
MVERFARLLVPLALACVVIATICASFVSITGLCYPDPRTYYYSVLDQKEAEARRQLNRASTDRQSSMDALALILAQNGKYSEAATYRNKIWITRRDTAEQHYDPIFAENALRLASIYTNWGVLDSARTTYQYLYDYEKKRLDKNDKRVARDLNNLALSYFLIGETKKLQAERKPFFDKSLSLYEQAAAMLRSSPDSEPDLTFNSQNQALVLDEAGETEKAKKLNALVQSRFDQFHKQSKMFE